MSDVHVLSLSYGKDSLACLGAIKKLGLPLDRIVHVEIWATDTIPADLPPMMEFKKKADAIIKERYGIEVEHICALKTQGWVEANKHTKECSTKSLKADRMKDLSKDSLLEKGLGVKSSNMKTERLTYEEYFYKKYHSGKNKNKILGFPIVKGAWCSSRLKKNVIYSQIVQVERERERERKQHNAVSRHSG